MADPRTIEKWVGGAIPGGEGRGELASWEPEIWRRQVRRAVQAMSQPKAMRRWQLRAIRN